MATLDAEIKYKNLWTWHVFYKLHSNDYHGPPRIAGPQYISLHDKSEMEMISMAGPSFYGRYPQTKVII